ncbi:MAG TPA: PD-(D/E)XK nuclease family protein [Acidimicrobiales bacterium]|nr:PD-(D/E)XK nuclease family protein [Acidimicrobiales bacterium]
MSFPLPSTLTPSKISAFTSCPLSFRFSVVERLPEVASPQAVKGTLVHRALQLLFSEREAGDRDRLEAESALLRAWDEMRESADVVELALPEDELATFLRDASSLIDRYFELEDPNAVTPVGLELDLKVEVDGMTLRGIIDRLDRLPDGSLAVVDYKTGRAPRAEQSRSRLSSVQLYAFLCEQVLGTRPAVVRLMYLRDRVVVSADATDQSLRGVHQRARAVWAAIERACERSDFRPNPSALCRWCSFQEYCPAFGGDPERAAAQVPPTRMGGSAGLPAATLPA